MAIRCSTIMVSLACFPLLALLLLLLGEFSVLCRCLINPCHLLPASYIFHLHLSTQSWHCWKSQSTQLGGCQHHSAGAASHSLHVPGQSLWDWQISQMVLLLCFSGKLSMQSNHVGLSLGGSSSAKRLWDSLTFPLETPIHLLPWRKVPPEQGRQRASMDQTSGVEGCCCQC